MSTSLRKTFSAMITQRYDKNTFRSNFQLTTSQQVDENLVALARTVKAAYTSSQLISVSLGGSGDSIYIPFPSKFPAEDPDVPFLLGKLHAVTRIFFVALDIAGNPGISEVIDCAMTVMLTHVVKVASEALIGLVVVRGLFLL